MGQHMIGHSYADGALGYGHGVEKQMVRLMQQKGNEIMRQRSHEDRDFG